MRSRPFLVFLLVLGIFVLSYPLLADYYYQMKQNDEVKNHQQEVQSLQAERRDEIIKASQEYNAELAKRGKALFDPLRIDFIKKSLENNTFPEFFRPEKTVGTVRVPKIKTTIPIYSGTTADVLERGAGTMVLASLPVGGESTHAIVSAHRGLPQSRLFRDLGEVDEGDVFLLEVLGRQLAYQVDAIYVVKANEAKHLDLVYGADRCTLLTCHPYMVNSERLLVQGKRVPYNEKTKAAMQKQAQSFQWQLFLARYKEYLIGIGIFLLIYLILRRRLH